MVLAHKHWVLISKGDDVKTEEARRLRPRSSECQSASRQTTRRVDRSVTSQTQSPPRERFRFTPPVVSTSLVFSASLPPAVDLSVLHAAFQSGRRPARTLRVD